MANPIIIDDGGSTRIKRLVDGGHGAMNALLDVDMGRSPAQATGALDGPYNRIRGVSIDNTGTPTTVVNSPLIARDTFTIVSDNGQSVTAAIDSAGQCTISVQGSPGNPPLIEAKQFRGKRRYVVANAGPIQSIDGVANGAAFHFAANADTIYTTLIIRGEDPSAV